jgi:uncharacterized protein YecE (DUF72 family)
MPQSHSAHQLARVRIGPAGWSYKDWSGIVYPAAKPRGFDPLRYLAQYFDAIEIDSTFYGPMTRSTAESWLERVSSYENFRFTAKLWQRFTHERDTAWSADEIKLAREAFEVLLRGGRLGAVLVQFPWSFRNDDKNQEWLRDVISAFSDFPLVLEVRHSSWNTPEFYAQLEERGVGFVNIDQPLFRNSIAPSARATSHVGYIRVHGRNYQDWFRESAGPAERYNFLYSAQELAPWAERTKQVAESPLVKEVYVVTNNHYLGKAPANALMLKSMLRGTKVPSPPSLFAKYEDVLKDYAEPSVVQGSLPLGEKP